MKHLCVFVLALLTCASVLAQDKKSKSSASGVEQEILKLEDASRDAAVKGDASWIEKNLSDDFIRILSDGRVLDRQQFIDNFKKTKYDAIDFTDRKVRVYGNSALVNLTANVKGTSDGKDISGTNRATRVWVKIKGQWKLVNFQSTRVAQ